MIDFASRLAAVGALLAAGSSALGQSRPLALRNLQHAREAIQTAEIHYAWEPRQHGMPRTFYISRIAGPDEISANLGDEQGVVGRNPDRQGRPHSVLKTPTSMFSHEHDDVSMRMWETGRRDRENIFSLRALGASAQAPYHDLDATLWMEQALQPGDRRYVERQENGLSVVECHTDSGTTRWWIDPKRGWSPVRVTFESGGEIISEARIELAEFDGFWFPRTVEIYGKHYRDGKEPADVYTVLSAEFNRPEHPSRFTPADIGIEPGFLIELDDLPPGSEVQVWDGQQAVTLSEFDDMEAAGLVRRGPRNVEALDRLTEQPPPQSAPAPPGGAPEAGGPAQVELLRTRISRWEAYTRRFIERHKLDSEQTEKAWQILAECQKKAHAYLDDRRERIEALERELADARAAAEPGQRSKTAELERRLSAAAGPVDEIFEQQLRPRLQALLKPSQRQAEDAPR